MYTVAIFIRYVYASWVYGLLVSIEEQLEMYDTSLYPQWIT